MITKMFKNIIKGKKANFINYNILPENIQNIKLIKSSEYSFARKQVNKQDLVNEMNNIMANKKFEESNSGKNEETKKPLQDLNIILQHTLPEPSQEINELDNGKFYFDIISDLKAKNFPMEILENSLKLIDQKYPNTNSEKSTSFRFLEISVECPVHS